MQEISQEIGQKIWALSIQVGKGAVQLTDEMLQKALRSFLEAQKDRANTLHKGKQTLRQLMAHNMGVSNIEITDSNIKSFEKTARKYGIDFALKKDISSTPPRYLVFFKGRDADVMTAAFQEFTSRNLAKEKKPSLRKLLTEARGQQAQRKVPEKVKVKDREVGR